jgi:hypothetical protein
VRAVRDALNLLREPFPRLFADLLEVEELPELSGPLPLVDFSPFGALEDLPPAHQPSPADDPGGHPRRSIGDVLPDREGGRASPLSRPSEHARDDRAPSITMPGSPGPIFSLRRGGESLTAGKAESTTSGEERGSHDAGPSRQSSLIPDASTAPVFRLRSELDAPDRSRAEQAGTAFPNLTGRSVEPPHVAALLDTLAGDLLDRAPAVAPNNGARSRADQVADMAASTTRPASAVGAFSGKRRETASSTATLDSVSGLGLVDALADELFNQRPSAMLPPPGQDPPERPEHVDELRQPAPDSVSRSAAAPGREVLTEDDPQLGELTRGVPPLGSALDAHTLAALINDVLVEQAERHGMDLL